DKEINEDEPQELELSVTTGKLAPASTVGYPKGAYKLAGDYTGYFASQEGEKLYMGWVIDGKSAWKKIASDFDPAGYKKSEDGYLSTEVPKDLINLNHSRVWPDLTKGSVSATMTGRHISIQFDKKTGKVLWREENTNVDCLGADGGINEAQTGPQFSTRCRYSGKVTRTYRGKASYDITTGKERKSVNTDYREVSITVEGYDPQTGKTLWSVPVLNRDGLLNDSDTRYIPTWVNSDSVLVQMKEGPRVLNLRTGKTKAALAADTFWCFEDVDYAVIEPQYLTQEGQEPIKRYLHLGYAVASSCLPDRKPSTQIPKGPATEGAGVTFGDISVVSLKDRFVGYQVR
ncbi:MAG: hypothetical protein ACRC0L_06955, partial [Angustibacter sp.]